MAVLLPLFLGWAKLLVVKLFSFFFFFFFKARVLRLKKKKKFCLSFAQISISGSLSPDSKFDCVPCLIIFRLNLEDIRNRDMVLVSESKW